MVSSGNNHFSFSRVLSHLNLPRSLEHKSPRLLESNRESTNRTKPPIFALTIGIDKYKSTVIDDLHGCVADADDIVKFLTKTLHVCPIHITNLRNRDATAKNLSSALQALATDPRIPKDANSILIFYAGHGSEALPPEDSDLPSNEMIQTLLPYDFDPGMLIARNGLADIKLARLLENIANEKGNDITVILDSCHAGSGTRDFGGVKGVRGVRLSGDTRLGANALPAPHDSVSEQRRYQGLASHVLLAACNPQQQAHEKNGRGAFTLALTKLLRSANLENVTYTDIIKRLPEIDQQDPHCEGNRHRIFLDNHPAKPHDFHFSVTQPNKGVTVYDSDAGEADGVTVAAEFAVYDTAVLTNMLGRLVVNALTQSGCTLHLVEGQEPFDLPEAGAFAILTRLGTMHDIRLHVEFKGDFSDELTVMSKAVLEKLGLGSSMLKVAAAVEPNPGITASASGRSAHFHIWDKTACEVGFHETPHYPQGDGEENHRYFTKFYWNLFRTTSGKHMISPKIKFECYELANGTQPIGGNLFIDGIIHVGIGAIPKRYGFRITNTSKVLLFISMFYFSKSDLRIDSYYEPPFAARNNSFPALSAGGSLTIGYGSGGAPAPSFCLDNGQDVNVEYLKLFLSTRYVDYSHVAQEFLLDRGTNVYKHDSVMLWDTMLIPLVMRREVQSRRGRY